MKTACKSREAETERGWGQEVKCVVEEELGLLLLAWGIPVFSCDGFSL